jgi:cytochrome c551/c552
MKNILITAMLVIGFVATAKVVKIQMPVETAVYKNAPGSALANAQCLTCHSADYASMQPPKPRDFWAGEVAKMKGKYGASIPDEQTNELVAYFAKTYGTDTTETTTAAHFDSTVLDAQTIATKMGCLTCHNVAKKVIGPAYKDVAAKYAKDANAMDHVRQQIVNGGSGKWGTVPMPGYGHALLSQEQIDALAKWVLSQNGK